jgi:hypothetical protein
MRDVPDPDWMIPTNSFALSGLRHVVWTAVCLGLDALELAQLAFRIFFVYMIRRTKTASTNPFAARCIPDDVVLARSPT